MLAKATGISLLPVEGEWAWSYFHQGWVVAQGRAATLLEAAKMVEPWYQRWCGDPLTISDMSGGSNVEIMVQDGPTGKVVAYVNKFGDGWRYRMTNWVSKPFAVRKSFSAAMMEIVDASGK